MIEFYQTPTNNLNDYLKFFVKNKSDLELLKAVYDKIGVEYHCIKEDNYTYIRKLYSGEKQGYYIYLGKLHKIKNSYDLGRFIKFDHNGSLVSF